jgi:hypothetical protein
MKLPPLTELRAFKAAARCRSFKLAAAELGVTPTAVSHQIRSLEAYCGQALFRRQPRPITLTSAGEQLFPVVRDGFGSFVEAINVVRAGGTATRLRLTTTNAFAARWLVPRLPQWRKAHSRLKLEIVSTDEVLSLKNGEADISIRYVRSTPTDGPSFELTRDRFHVVAAPKLVGISRKAPDSSRARTISPYRGGVALKRCGSANLATVGSSRPKASPARSGSFRPCQLKLSRRASRHRSCCFGPRDRDLQRLAGGSRTCERSACEANERDDAGLRLLHRAQGKPSEDDIDQSLRSLGHGSLIEVC